MNQRRIKTLVNNLQTATTKELFEVINQIKQNEGVLFVDALTNTMRKAIYNTEEQYYNIELQNRGEHPITVIKTLRELFNYGLHGAKRQTDFAGLNYLLRDENDKIIQLTELKARQAKADLTAAGATVFIHRAE
jgi:ribosomal protein L7/L12